jgi:hypothetical protein
MKSILRIWIPVTLILTAVFGTIYIVSQQLNRQSFNMSPIDAVNEASYTLDRNLPLDDFLQIYTFNTPVDKTSRTFIIIYDDKGKPLQSTAKLDDNTPNIPLEVLEGTPMAPSYKIITWMPRSGLRIAVAIQQVHQGNNLRYVLAGRNLKQSEQLNEYVLFLVAAAWMATVVGSLFMIALLHPKQRAK